MISEQLNRIKLELPQSVDLVAVSKFHTPDAIMEAYNAGQRLFGENRPQELAQKAPLLPKDIKWHFLGHLQKNKIKLVVPNAYLIQSVDTEELLRAIDSYAAQHGIRTRCLLEVYIAKEESKQGFSPEEIKALLNSLKQHPLASTTICGLMGMASFTSDTEQVRGEFKRIAELYNEIKSSYSADFPEFKTLSIGMSGDYRIAVEEGSTMVRIGTGIFGPRNYTKTNL